jgi:hypothetical protein
MIVAAEAGRQMPLTGLPVTEMVVISRATPVPEIVPSPVAAAPVVMGVTGKAMKMAAVEMAMVESVIMESMAGKSMVVKITTGKSVSEAAVGSAAATCRRIDTGEHGTQQTNRTDSEQLSRKHR